MSPRVSIRRDTDRDVLRRAWEALQEHDFPGSGEQLSDELADELSSEMVGEDSCLAGAVSTLIRGGRIELHNLEMTNARYASLLSAGRERRGDHPDIERVLEYAERLEALRELALRSVD